MLIGKLVFLKYLVLDIILMEIKVRVLKIFSSSFFFSVNERVEFYFFSFRYFL